MKIEKKTQTMKKTKKNIPKNRKIFRNLKSKLKNPKK